LKTVIVHGNFRNGKKDGSAVSPVPDRYWWQGIGRSCHELVPIQLAEDGATLLP
jgi:hypothetical protein